MAPGIGLVLDAKLRTSEGEVPVFRAPAFQFATDDIEAAYAYMREQGVEVVTEIMNGHFFNFRDPDGNLLMVCAPVR